jgi:heme exporter protein D
MNWGSAGEFFFMGGYGLYVWGSYTAAAVLMAAKPLLARHRHRQALHAVESDAGNRGYGP